jgi:Geranylgeranyl pyrophosphate synthase
MNDGFSLVFDDLAAVEKELLSLVQSSPSISREIGTRLVQAGGKRLRPALFLLCAKQEGATSKDKVRLAAAIELIHMASLVHDDVIDFSATRRGLPTANVLFGNHAAVLTGDYLFAQAYSIVVRLPFADSLRILADVIRMMCEGEILQMQDLYSLDQTILDYYHKINCKTANFIAASCELGGGAAQYHSADVAALRQYGYSVGMALQIIDDILDVTARTEDIGKPTGHDIGQGILTLPVLYALQHGNHRKELRHMIESRSITGNILEQALLWIRERSTLHYCYEQANAYLKQAREVLPSCLPENTYAALVSVTEFIGSTIQPDGHKEILAASNYR